MFVLKKIVAQLFFPAPLCLEILIAGLILLLITKKQRAGKIVISVGTALFMFLSYPILSNTLLKRLEHRHPPLITNTASDFTPDGAIPPVKWIVVLGGGHTSDQKIPLTGQLSGASLFRLIEAIRLHNQIPGSRLIVSEGKVFDPVSGAETMAAVARSMGVKEEDIVLEADSRDTIDEARLIKPIVGDDAFILVTSASHMPRSMGMFRKLGMNPVAAPTDYAVKERQGVSPSDFFPDTSSFRKSENVIYEYLGLLWAKLRGQI